MNFTTVFERARLLFTSTGLEVEATQTLAGDGECGGGIWASPRLSGTLEQISLETLGNRIQAHR